MTLDPTDVATAGLATARAQPNMALVKYWGKSDATLNLPTAGSLSLTFDVLPTTTTVEVVPGSGSGSADADHVEINGRVVEGTPRDRVVRFLDLVRTLAGSTDRAIVRSRNEAPTGAGLASSASGFAALALAASTAYGLSLDAPALSRLARRGSGSASRSVLPGVARWVTGDDATSYASEVSAPDLAFAIVVLESGEKAVSSREAMARSVASPGYADWVAATERDLIEISAACEAGDVDRIGTIAEANALRMHALIEASEPPVAYLTEASRAVFAAAASLRAAGIGVWGTADAGPNVALLTRPSDLDAVVEAVAGFGTVIRAHAGPGARLVDDAVSPAADASVGDAAP